MTIAWEGRDIRMSRKTKKQRKRTRVIAREGGSNSMASPAHRHETTTLGTEGMRAYAQLAATDPQFKILYFIPHGPQDLDKASPLGWFTPGLHEAAGPLILASLLPADIREPYSARRDVLMQRLLRHIWKMATPIQLDTIAAFQPLLPSPFQVYITNREAVADAIDSILAKAKFPCLHISSIPGQGRKPVEGFDVDELVKYIHQVVESLSQNPDWIDFAKQARKVMPESQRRNPEGHMLALGSHNVVAPNEIALEAFGWKITHGDPVIKHGEEKPFNSENYVERICLSADAVFEERAKLLEQLSPWLCDYRYIIAVHGVYWGHYEHWRRRTVALQRVNKRFVRQWYLAAIRIPTYFDSINIKAEERDAALPVYAALNRERAADTRAFTAGLAYLAAASLAPVLRLEPRLYQARGDLKLLAGCVRASGRHHVEWKLSRLTHALGLKLRSLINPKFLDRIDRINNAVPIEGIKLVTDLPLEWMPSNSVPLFLRYDVSRIPVLPGNMFIANCVMPPAILPLEAFRDVLVIRSFHDDDPLKLVLQKTLEVGGSSPTGFECRARFVDVNNEEQFVKALENFNGACMIFDGHGTYDSDIGSGSVVIGGKAVGAWQLRKRCHVPPIVIFSACDTQPLDGSHSSSAMAAFVLGARTVLGTSLPIDARTAARFIARLMLRIAEFIPQALELRLFLTWREVVSGMLRMTHVSDVLHTIDRHGGVKLKQDDFQAIQLKANMLINARSPDWYERFLEAYAHRTEQTTDQIKTRIALWSGLTESMKYVQLGSPENLIIVREAANAVFSREADRAPGRPAGAN